MGLLVEVPGFQQIAQCWNVRSVLDNAIRGAGFGNHRVAHAPHAEVVAPSAAARLAANRIAVRAPCLFIEDQARPDNLETAASALGYISPDTLEAQITA